MASILYCVRGGEVVQEVVRDAVQVSHLLSQGYKADPNEFNLEPESAELTLEELRAEAEEKGIEGASTMKTKTLKKVLGYEQSQD